jgi:hypothetical protein
MALPVFYPFKTRVLNATATSSNSIASVVVPARAKLITAWLATNPGAAQTAQGAVDLTVNGSTAAGMGGIAITTSTGNSSTNLGGPSSLTYLNSGDILGS